MEPAMPRREQEFIDHTLLAPEYIRESNNSHNFIMDLIDTPVVFSKNGVNVSTATQPTNSSDYTVKDALSPELHFHSSIFQFVNKPPQLQLHNDATSATLSQPTLAITSDDAAGFGHKHTSDFITLNSELFGAADNKAFCDGVAGSSDVANGNVQQFPTLSLLEEPGVGLHDGAVIQDGDVVYARSNARKVLPHKKRISRKLKVGHNGLDPSSPDVLEQHKLPGETLVAGAMHFSCELCEYSTSSQLLFFAHLKQHYEPSTPDTILDAIKTRPERTADENNVDRVFQDVHLNFEDFPNVDTSVRHVIHQNPDDDMKILTSNSIDKCMNYVSQTETTPLKHITTDEVEFSDTEDMLEGIRNVVDKVSIEDTCDDIELMTPNGIRPAWFTGDNFCDIAFKTKQLSDLPTSESLEQLRPQEQVPKVTTTLKAPEVEKFPLFPAEDATARDNLEHRNKHNPYDTRSKEGKHTVWRDEGTDNSDKTQEISSKRSQEKLNKRSSARKKKEIPKSPRKSDDDADVDDNDDDDDCEPDEDEDLSSEEFDQTKRRYVCMKCNRHFNSSNALKYHNRTHSGVRPHQCDKCGRSFFAQGALKSHLLTHTGDKPFECEHCHRKFRQWGDLKYHVISIHTEEKSHQCEFCGKAFSRKYSLVLHRRIHTSERNYKCDYCGKSFRASTYLQNHRKIHTGEKPHECDVCGKRFRVGGDLRRHKRIHDRKLKVKEETSDDDKAFMLGI